MPIQSVDRNAIAVWRWEALFTCLVILVGSGIPFIAGRISPLLAAALLGVILLLLLSWILWYPPAKYRHLGYRLDGNGITIRQGVFWRTQSSVARVRIQHTDVTQGPLQRRYGIATLKLYTAGSSFTKIELPGLTQETAIALRDELQREGDGDAV